MLRSSPLDPGAQPVGGDASTPLAQVGITNGAQLHLINKEASIKAQVLTKEVVRVEPEKPVDKGGSGAAAAAAVSSSSAGCAPSQYFASPPFVYFHADIHFRNILRTPAPPTNPPRGAQGGRQPRRPESTWFSYRGICVRFRVTFVCCSCSPPPPPPTRRAAASSSSAPPPPKARAGPTRPRLAEYVLVLFVLQQGADAISYETNFSVSLVSYHLAQNTFPNEHIFL